jgi:hypothetical protein
MKIKKNKVKKVSQRNGKRRRVIKYCLQNIPENVPKNVPRNAPKNVLRDLLLPFSQPCF